VKPSTPVVQETTYGFRFGPMLVERVIHDERIGYVVVARPEGAHEPKVEIRVSPSGRVWDVRTTGRVNVRGQ